MARKSKRRTRRKSKKRGSGCEYKKVDGKWKNVCTETKKNFKIKKTDMLTSKIGYNVRKKKQQKEPIKGGSIPTLATLSMP